MAVGAVWDALLQCCMHKHPRRSGARQQQEVALRWVWLHGACAGAPGTGAPVVVGGASGGPVAGGAAARHPAGVLEGAECGPGCGAPPPVPRCRPACGRVSSCRWQASERHPPRGPPVRPRWWRPGRPCSASWPGGAQPPGAPLRGSRLLHVSWTFVGAATLLTAVLSPL